MTPERLSKVAVRTLPSSSNPKINPESLPGAVDAKRVDRLGARARGYEDGVKILFFLEEEGVTGDRAQGITRLSRILLTAMLSDIPTDSEMRAVGLEHCWAGVGISSALGLTAGSCCLADLRPKHVTAWPAKWTKFRTDLVVAQLAKGRSA